MSQASAPSEDQKEFIDRVKTATGLSLERLAELLGLKLATMRKIYYRDVNLTDRNRAALAGLMFRYRHGEPILGHREPPAGLSVAESSSPAAAPVDGPRALLRHQREALGLTQRELADRIGYPVDLVQSLEEGRAQLTEKVAGKLAAALELEPEELLGGSDTPRIIDLSGTTGTYGATPTIQLPAGVEAKLVPRLSYVQAGAMHEWTDEAYNHEGVLALHLPKHARAFALPIRGDSMEPRLFEGDEVIVLWGVQPTNGQVVVACTASAEVMCKVYTSQNRGRRVILTSYNAAAHPPIELEREEIRWIYPVHSVTRQLIRNFP